MHGGFFSWARIKTGSDVLFWCFGDFTPQPDVFIAVQFCFSVSETDVKNGVGGLRINLFSHPFHSSKRLRLQWRDQGYKDTRNPPNTAKKKKALQTAKPCLRCAADPCLFTKSAAELRLGSLTGCFIHAKPPVRVMILAAGEQQGIYRCVQCESGAAFVLRFALKKPHLMYFPPPLSSSPLKPLSPQNPSSPTLKP